MSAHNWTNNTTAVVLTWTNGTINYEAEAGVVQKFEYTTNQQFERIHGAGYDEFNIGVVRKPPSYEWIMELFVSSEAIRALRALMSAKHPFKITVSDSVSFETENKTFDANGVLTSTTKNSVNLNARENELLLETLSKCYVTSMDTSYVSTEAPTVTFSGVAYEHDFESYAKDNEDVDTVYDITAGTLGSGKLNAGAIDAKGVPLPPLSFSLFEDDWNDVAYYKNIA